MERGRNFITVPIRTRARAAWLATTALTMLSVAPAAHAQSIGPDTSPQGGAVVGGSASISQSAGSTIVNQSSARTAINWQSFNVGSAATVRFNQPDASALALNRVVTPNPSIIAGHIDANGQIVLINQSGVVFTKGSQVNAESIFVSTSDIATKDFMAGKLNFSGTPAPGAKIENDGQLTAKQAGLVGLVAPQVINNGVITATLGQVVLAGASAFTLDLYGDRLISLDVTKAVSEVDIGGKTVAGLVTNRGIILADGGKITLTAMDADALVTALIQAGGTIRADSVGSAQGAIILQAVGGDIQIAGSLLARGTAAGAGGGVIAAAASGTIVAAPGALADASGAAGGGQIALGRALGDAPKAAAVGIAAGAILKADATRQGNGGSVLLDSQGRTDFGGAISVQGGTLGGDGGFVDISSAGVISLGGTVLDTAINGQAGEILLDPATLVVGTGTTPAAVTGNTLVGGTGGATTSYITPDQLNMLTGHITLSAAALVTVMAGGPVDIAGANSSLLITVMNGAVSLSSGVTSAGSLEIDATTTIAIDAPVSAASDLILNATGANVFEGTGGAITAATLIGTAGTLSLTGANAIGTLGNLTVGANIVTPGNIVLANSGSLIIDGVVSTPGSLALADGGTVTELTGGAIQAAEFDTDDAVVGGSLSLTGNNVIGTLGGVSVTGAFLLADSSTLDLTGVVQASDVELAASNAIDLGAAGKIKSPAGNIALAPDDNGILDLGTVAGGDLTIASGLLSKLDPTASLVLGQAAGHTASNLLTGGPLSFGNAVVHLLASTLIDNAGTLITTGQMTLNGATLINDGSIGAPGVAFDTTGSFTGTGSINALELSGSVGNGITLTGPNKIDTLGSISAGTNIIFVDDEALDIAGVVSAANSISLEDSGAVTELTNGTIDAKEFDTGGVTDGGLLLTIGNEIGTLGNVAAAGDIRLVNGVPLSIAGNISTTSNLTLDNTGEVSQATVGSAIDVGELFIRATGADSPILLGATSNSIPTLGNVTTGSTFYLADDTGLDVLGSVQAADISLAVNGALSLGSALSVSSAGDVEIASSQIIFASGGTIVAPSGTIALAPYDDNGTLYLGGTTSDGLSLVTLPTGLDPAAVLLVLGSAAGHQASTVRTDGAFAFDNDTIALAASSLISIGGEITGNTLALDNASLVSEPSFNSELDVTKLIGTNVTAAVLQSNFNNIATLGNFQAGTLSLSDNEALTINGLVNIGTVFTLDDLSDVVESSIVSGGMTLNGVIDAATLTTDNGDGGSIGGNLFLTNSNAIVTLSVIDVHGAIDIVDAGSYFHDIHGGDQINIGVPEVPEQTITVDGVTATNVLITNSNIIASNISATGATGTVELDMANTIFIAGNISGPSVDLNSGRGVFETTAAGVIDAQTLAGVNSLSGDVSLTSANSIGTLGAYTVAGASSFFLNDAAPLTIAGPVDLVPGTIGPGGVFVPGTLVSGIFTPGSFAMGTLVLSGTGPVAETDGVIVADRLTTGAGSIAGEVTLSGANTINTLGNFTLAAGDSLALTDLAVLTIAGTVDVPGVFSLASAPGVTEVGTGVIAGGTFTNGGSPAAFVLLTNVNSLSLFSDVSATGDITLTNAMPSLIAQDVFGGPAVVIGNTGLLDAGAISGGYVSLSGSTVIAGGITATGTPAGNIDIFSGTSITLDGPIDAPGVVTLASGTGVLETTGTISAATLTGANSISGDVVLTNANSITVLTDYSLAGTGVLGFGIDGFGTMSGSGSLILNDNGNGIAPLLIAGTVNVPDVFSLTDANGVSETGSGSVIGFGAFTAANVDDGSVLLDGHNQLQLFTDVTASNDIDLNNYTTPALYAQKISAGPSAGIYNADRLNAHDISAGLVTLSGNFVDAGGISGNVVMIDSDNSYTAVGDSTSTAGTSIVLDGPVDAGILLSLISDTGVTESGLGTITAATLTGANSISGDVALTGANSIGTLASYTLAGDNALALNDDASLTISGPVDIIAGTVTSGSIFTAGTVVSGRFTPGTFAAGALVLTGTGPVNEAQGSINVATLTTGTGAIDGDVTLTGLNDIGTLNNFTVSPASLFALNDDPTLVIDGTVNAGIFDLTTSDPQGTAPVLERDSGVIIAQTFTTDQFINGTLIAGTGSIDGYLSLLSANSIAVFGDVSATGAISLHDLDSPALAAVTAPYVLISTPGSITLDGLVSSGSALELDSGTGVSEASGGIIDAPTLLGGNSIGGDVDLTNANSIATLGNYALAGTGNLSLDDLAVLTIAGAADVPGIFAAGVPAGVIEAGAGRIDAGSFTGGDTVENFVSLSGSNSIGLFTDVAALGDIILDDFTTALSARNISAGADASIGNSGALEAAGISGGNINLRSGSDITLDGAINARTLVSLASATGVTETGAGTISAPILTGTNSLSGDVALTNANAIGTLSAYDVAGNNALILNNAAPLTIAGPIDVVSGTFALSGTGPVNEAGGTISAAALITGAHGISGNVNLAGTNRIDALGSFDVTGPGALLALNDATQLTIDGAVTAGTFALTDSAPVLESGGAITARTFSTDVFANGSVASLLLSGSNAIDTLSRVAVNSFITLVNDKALTIAGEIFATDSFALDNAGSVTELDVALDDGVILNGVIHTAEFDTDGAVTGGGLLLNGGNTIATLGNVGASGDISLANQSPLTLDGTVSTPGSFALGDSGAVTEVGGAIDAAEFDSGKMTIGGALSLGGSNAIGTLGAVTVDGDMMLNDNEGLVFIGPAVATKLNLSVSNGPLTLQGSVTGGLFVGGTIEQSTSLSTPGTLDSTINVSDGTSPAIVQTGTFYVNSGPHADSYQGVPAQPATVFLNAGTPGGITFAAYPDYLSAPSVDLVLSAGPRGTATGNVSLYFLEVLQAASTNLTGFIQGVSGPPAAGHATALPDPAPIYQFNACPIGSVNCVLLQLQTLPLENPLENFDVSVPKRRHLNAKIRLPGIATRDY